MKRLYVTTAKEWRSWLRVNHDSEMVVWLIFYKKETGTPCIAYDSAVEEALCYGWIDSIIKKIDDKTYARKFTPRKEKSNWSDLNKKRAAKLIKNKRMTKIGLAAITAAKKNGMWERFAPPTNRITMPQDFQKALNNKKIAKQQFEKLAPGYRNQYIMWVSAAKRPDTRERRIKESLELLERGEKLGMK